MPAEDGAPMPGVLLKPADFDSTQEVSAAVLRVRGAGQHGGRRTSGAGYYLWHTMLTQQGYLVAVVDNRGTPAPLGRGLAQGDLRADGRASRPAIRRPRPGQLLQRPYVDPEPGRHLGLELRRPS